MTVRFDADDERPGLAILIPEKKVEEICPELLKELNTILDSIPSIDNDVLASLLVRNDIEDLEQHPDWVMLSRAEAAKILSVVDDMKKVYVEIQQCFYEHTRLHLYCFGYAYEAEAINEQDDVSVIEQNENRVRWATDLKLHPIYDELQAKPFTYIY